MNNTQWLTSQFKSILKILKTILPLFILFDILNYFQVLQFMAPLFSVISNFLNLPNQGTIGLIAGGFFNMYAGIAILAPLKLSVIQWTTVGVFMGFFHSTLIEGAVLKKIGIPFWPSFFLRLFFGLLFAHLVTLVPNSFFK
jgi:hypothetical protein